MYIQAKVTGHFAHGSRTYAIGDTIEVTKSEAEEMQKSGLVEIVSDAPQKEKQAPEVENKMADAVDNKSMSKRK